jgi:hypothetical protein
MTPIKATAISRRGWGYVAAFAAILLLCVGWVKLTFWRSNRISPQFLSAGRSAYRSIRECDDRISGDASVFLACITKAENEIVSLSHLPITQREHMEYAALRYYLTETRECRRDWEMSDISADAVARHQILVDLRLRLGKTYEMKGHDRPT